DLITDIPSLLFMARSAKGLIGTRPSPPSKFEAQGHTPAVADYLAEPYPRSRAEGGAGHHSPISQETARGLGLPDSVRDSPFNVLRPRGISRGDFYELHFRVDPSSSVNRLPRSVGGGAWNANRIPGLRRYGPLGRAWHGTPDALKGAVGGGVISGAGLSNQQN